jgi:hypothetical protein
VNTRDANSGKPSEDSGLLLPEAELRDRMFAKTIPTPGKNHFVGFFYAYEI